MHTLIVGSGGREHALGWRLVQDNPMHSLFFLPGNGGTHRLGRNLPGPLNYPRIREAVELFDIGMVVFGPEAPLVEGWAERLRHDFGEHLAVVGPDREGARLEGSKAFAKNFMRRHGIPTAEYRTFGRSEHRELIDYLKRSAYPLVLKASGLAAGKGVVICQNTTEAFEAVERFFVQHQFGQAGHQVIVEHFLDGQECSVFIVTDGHTYRYLPSARDYKRAYDADQGPNTGGMGAFTPVPYISNAIEGKIRTQIIERTLDGLQQNGIAFRGFLFFGLMIVDGNPYVLEYNIRLGDPETQVILPMTEGPFAEVLEGVARGRLSETGQLSFRRGAQLAVIAAAEGYPISYEKGYSIQGIEDAESVPHVTVFHAGTHLADNGTMYTAGGRVLAVSAHGHDLSQARSRAYQAIEKIRFQGMFYRRDIGR